MLVYRIEDKKRQGAYSVADDRRTAHACFDDVRHPSPSKDALPVGRLTSRHLFGFASPKDLVRWFPRAARQALACYDTGCGLGVYKVHRNAVLFGKRQIAFNLRVAKRVSFRKFTLDSVKK